jgi:L-ascorbate metabolism protein UlaG (beta-lactamase superfamily)
VRYDIDGTRLLTDPLLTKRVAHLRRRVPLPDDDLTDVDLVLISHAHMDHLHLRSLKRVNPAARIIVPQGLARVTRSLGHDVVEISRGERFVHGPVVVEAVHAEHAHGRGPHSRTSADPVGYVIEGAGTRAYFPGDTALFDEMTQLERIDVATIPIWGWGPTLGGGHLDPLGAVEATARIAPHVVVPMHWGTYSPENGRRGAPSWFRSPLGQFERGLAERGLSEKLRVLEPGQSLVELGQSGPSP